MSEYRNIGIVGGLGPLASANFYLELVRATTADSDQSHPRVVMISEPAIPSRLAHLDGAGPSPVPALADVIRSLESLGAEVIALPSITTHAYLAELRESVATPIVDGLAAVGDALRAAGTARVAVAMTTPARRVGLLERGLLASGVECVKPPEREQARIQQLVDGVKEGKPLDRLASALLEVLQGGWTDRGDGLMIGCTDISPLAPLLPLPVHDVARIYAKAVIEAATVGGERGSTA